MKSPGAKKRNWGGRRNPPGGRPSTMMHQRQTLIIDASDEEKRLIIDRFSTRERTEILLTAIAQRPATGRGDEENDK